MRFESNEALTTFLKVHQDLTRLEIENSAGLTSLTEPLPSRLTHLVLTNCSYLSALPSVPQALTSLRVDGCRAFTSLPRLPQTLVNLLVYNSPNLANLPPLPDGLLYLRVENCPKLATLPTLPDSLIKRGEVRVYNCPAVTGMGLRVGDRIVDIS